MPLNDLLAWNEEMATQLRIERAANPGQEAFLTRLIDQHGATAARLQGRVNAIRSRLPQAHSFPSPTFR